VWTNFQGANRLVYPTPLELHGTTERPAFLEKRAPMALVSEKAGLVSDTVFGVRLVDVFGNALGSQPMSWTSSAGGDAAVDASTTDLTNPSAIADARTAVGGISRVRLFVSGAVAQTRTLTAAATSDPVLRQSFDVAVTASSAAVDVEVRGSSRARRASGDMASPGARPRFSGDSRRWSEVGECGRAAPA
jgi:hypothetical protein